jgi:hypothetical protein
MGRRTSGRTSEPKANTAADRAQGSEGTVMKLYHFTKQENLLGIAMSGLEPQIAADVPVMTMGQLVVWLTTQQTLTPTEDDLAFMREHRANYVAEFTETLLPGRDFRLTVNLDQRLHRKKLFHYHTWMHETPITMSAYDDNGEPIPATRLTGRDVLRLFPGGLQPSSKNHWWIYLGTIKPGRIADVAEHIEASLANHIEQGNADGIKRLTELRDKVRAAPPDTLLDITSAG